MARRLGPSRSRTRGTSSPSNDAAGSGQLALTLLPPVALQPGPRLRERGRERDPLLVHLTLCQLVVVARAAHELLLVHPAVDAARPHAQVVARALDVLRDLFQLLHHAEVREREALGLMAKDVVERPLPDLEVDVRRRGVRKDVPRPLEAHSARIAGVERALLVQIADVMRSMARRGERDEPELAVARYLRVLGRHRRRLAVQRVQPVAVD